MHIDDVKKRIYDALTKRAPLGLTRTEISGLFSRHLKTDEIVDALDELIDEGKIMGSYERLPKRGRPKETWYKK